MKNKLKNISIKFLKKTKIEETFELFKAFIHNRYDEIFFKELILEGASFSLYITNNEELLKIYDLLGILDKKEIDYKLISYSSMWDSEDMMYIPQSSTMTLDEFKNSEIEYREVETKNFNFDINDFALSSDGKYIVTATERNMFLWCAKTYKCLAHHIAWDGTAEKIYFSSDSKYFIALINDMGSCQDTIQVWKPFDENVTQWEWLQEEDGFDLEYAKVQVGKLAPSLPYLFSSLEKSCYDINYNFYREFYTQNCDYKAVYHKKSLSLYRMDKPLANENCTLINEIKLRISSDVKALCFSNDTNYICIGEENDIELFDTKELKQLKVLHSHEKKVMALATSHDNQYLLSASLDQTLKLWSLESFELITTIESEFKAMITTVNFSVDSKKILASSQEGIKVWDIESKKASFHLFNDEGFWCLLDDKGVLLDKGELEEK